MTRTNLDQGRRNQKLQTRQDLLDAAVRVMARGGPASVDAVAAEAGISRATAFRYFANWEAIAAEAALHELYRAPEDHRGHRGLRRPRLADVGGMSAAQIRRQISWMAKTLVRAAQAKG